MPVDPSTNELWKACPPGTLKNMAHRNRMRRTIFRLASMSVPLMIGLLGLSVYWSLSQLSDNHKTQTNQLTCAEVGVLLPRFANHSISESVKNQVEQHLAICPLCRERFEELRDNPEPVVWSWFTPSRLGVLAFKD